MFYLDETLADVAGTEGFVAAGGQSQARQEEEESGGRGRGEGRLSRPHPDSSAAPLQTATASDIRRPFHSSALVQIPSSFFVILHSLCWFGFCFFFF